MDANGNFPAEEDKQGQKDFLLCSECGNSNPREAKFCMQCGAELSERTVAVTKPIWHFIVLIFVAIICVVFFISKTENDQKKSAGIMKAFVNTLNTNQNLSESEFKQQCVIVSSEEMNTDSNGYMSQDICIKGVLVSYHNDFAHIHLMDRTGTPSDVDVDVDIHGCDWGSKIKVNDKLTIYGVMFGMSGNNEKPNRNTIPLLYARYVDMN